MRIITRTKLGFHAGAVGLGSSDLSIKVNTHWLALSGTIDSGDCLEGMLKIGDSKPYVYAIHESLSRVAEHYTNNCLRVKSNFFGRPNSFEWADDCEVQNVEGCGDGGSASDCCEALITYGPDNTQATATASYSPPDLPPAAVQDFVQKTITTATIASNTCGFSLDGGCLVFPQSGSYSVNAATFVAALTGSIISWVNTAAAAYATISVRMFLQIGPYAFDIVNQSLDTLSSDTDCNSDSISLTYTPAYSTPFTFFVSQAMINNNTNRLCLKAELSAEVLSFTACDDPPGFASMSAQAALILSSGAITITQTGCVPSYGTPPGSMATSNCDCDDPQPFPICSETFNPVPFQVAEPNCYAFMVLTSGLSLRQFGTECFVTFEELFSSLNALFNLGVGYTEAEPNVLRVESWEHFYQETVILTYNDVDLYHAKYKRKVLTEWYYNKYDFGYTTWLRDKVATLYEFNTTRTYTLPVKHVDTPLERKSKYIGSPYAIEKQRRDVLSSNADYDNEIFFICTGPSVDDTNTAQVTDGVVTVNYPSHMWIAEHGMNYPQNMPSWKWVLNYRIAPFRCMFIHWEPTLNIGLWHTDTAATLDFVKGDANFRICGTEVFHNNINCSKGYSCENQSMPSYGNSEQNSRRLFPEIVTLNLPLTVADWRVIKTNPYGQIAVNEELFYIREVKFKVNAESELTLIRASRSNPSGI
jgi:hypothetical protein